MAKAATAHHTVTLDLSSVHYRLAECEQRNGGCNISSGMACCVFFFYVLCYASRPLIHLVLQMLKYVLPYKCNCIIISNTINLLTPNVNYSGRTAPLTSKVAFYIFIQQIQVLNILNMVYTLRFFFVFKMQFVS